MILSVFSTWNVVLAECFTAFATTSITGMTGQEQNNCVFLFTGKQFLISVTVFVIFLAPRCTGSPPERFILCLVIYIFVSWMSKLCNVQGNENVELSKSHSRWKTGRNVSHGLALPERQDKILPPGETKKSLLFVYPSVRTDLSWGWEVGIRLCLFHMKTTVLIRKERRRKMRQLLDN